MTSNRIRAGTTVAMTHAQRQAFLKTSSLGQLFGVAHLLPEVDEIKNSNCTSFQKATKTDLLSFDQIMHQYEVLEGNRKGDHKWSIKVVSWKQIYSNVERRASAQKKILLA
ncbi:MAG: protochlorophyllide oxidoreductase [Hapalosiphonaceae cyanobacterium JJU2]|nr:MAG: protochlorophyllide oxidoreductase [Hapalosiphonaceae cyanobacterium JJU2]